MVYADYEYYTDTYLGRAITEADFPRLALRSSQYIDYITRGRAEARADLEEVKMCCCELADQYQAIDAAQELARISLQTATAGGAEVQSESVAAWSRSYRSGGDSALSAAQAATAQEATLYAVVQRHLAWTGLLYRGGGCLR